MEQREIYVSVDVETDGPIPGDYSMLSLGAAAFLPDKGLVNTFSVNLQPLEGARQDKETMKWWRKQPQAWEAATKDAVDPKVAMKKFVSWVKQLPGRPVFVDYPGGFDFIFVYWYLTHFIGESPFSFRNLGMATYASALLKKPFHKTYKRKFPKHWFNPKHKHTHIALDDAIEHGYIFMNMLRENLAKDKA